LGDVSVARSGLWGKVRDFLVQNKGKLVQEIMLAHAALDQADPSLHGEIFIKQTQQRLNVCVHCVGLRPVTVRESAPADGSEPKSSVITKTIVYKAREEVLAHAGNEVEKDDTEKGEKKDAEPSTKQAAKDAGNEVGKEGAEKGDKKDTEPLDPNSVAADEVNEDQKTSLSKAINACDINPLESSSLWCYPQLLDFHSKLGGLTRMADIEENQMQWDTQCHLLTQLLSSMKHATKELNAEVKRAAAKDKKTKEIEQKKRKEVLAQQTAEQEAQAKKQMTFQKEVMVFKLDFTAHTPVTTYPNDAKFAEMSAAGDGIDRDCFAWQESGRPPIENDPLHIANRWSCLFALPNDCRISNLTEPRARGSTGCLRVSPPAILAPQSKR